MEGGQILNWSKTTCYRGGGGHSWQFSRDYLNCCACIIHWRPFLSEVWKYSPNSSSSKLLITFCLWFLLSHRCQASLWTLILYHSSSITITEFELLYLCRLHQFNASFCVDFVFITKPMSSSNSYSCHHWRLRLFDARFYFDFASWSSWLNWWYTRNSTSVIIGVFVYLTPFFMWTTSSSLNQRQARTGTSVFISVFIYLWLQFLRGLHLHR